MIDLDVSNNFYGSLPDIFRRSNDLEFLYINNNHFIGLLPRFSPIIQLTIDKGGYFYYFTFYE